MALFLFLDGKMALLDWLRVASLAAARQTGSKVALVPVLETKWLEYVTGLKWVTVNQPLTTIVRTGVGAGGSKCTRGV